MTIKTSPAPLIGLVALALQPGVALAQSRLDVATVVGDSAPLSKVLMLLIVVAATAAVAVTAGKLASGRRLAGGSSFVSALRLGGPLVGLLGAVFNVLGIFIGIANAGEPVPFGVLSPGFAEAALLFLMGLFAGVVAVTCHWIIEARIDRTVLSS